MAKELPYFQFEPAEYLTKDISFCSLSAQGLFINLCSYYWQRECKLSKEQFLRRLNYSDEFKELLNEGVIDLNGDFIVIKFLDIQHKNITEKSKINSKNGSKGGRPKKPIKSELKPKLKPIKSETKGIREDEIIEEDIREKTALDILQEKKTEELQILWMQNSKYINDKDKLKNSFNNQMELEIAKGKIEFDENQLMPRFKNYLLNWVSNSEQTKVKNQIGRL